MKRRTFIQTSIVGGLAATLPISCNPYIENATFKIGYQLYSIRDKMAVAPVETLQLLKGLGYSDFEHFGFESDSHSFYGIAAQEFKTILDDMEVTITSGHYPFAPLLDAQEDELLRYVDQCIKGAQAIGSKFITWPWMAPEQRTLDNYKLLSKKLNIIGKRVSDAGLGFAYHNHGFEFEEIEGQTTYEIILSETDPEIVKLQMDMYWVCRAGKYTPSELIKKQPSRYVMWHIKDMDKNTRDYTELGNGSIDYKNILKEINTSGLQHFYIEQGGNFTKDSLQSATDSISYYKEHLQKFL